MKFTVSSKELFSQLNKISGAISANTVIPILEDFLVRLGDSSIQVTASDYETFMRIDIAVDEVDGSGEIAIPAKMLLDTLKGLPNQPVTIDIADNGLVKLVATSGEYQLAGEKGEDYPGLPMVEGENEIEFNAEVLRTAITSTLFAVSNDELRPAMTGVFLQVNENDLTFVSTDAHKLVKYTSIEDGHQSHNGFILPKKALTLLKNALGMSDTGLVKMKYSETNAEFEFDTIRLICRLIDARFPDYNAVIPKDNANLMTIDRLSLQNALKRLQIYSNKSTYQVVLSLAQDKLELSAQDVDFSNEANEELNCEYSGDELRIAFSARFLIEILGVLDTQEITFKLSTPNRAGVIVPKEQEEGKDLLMLVMPIMINT